MNRQERRELQRAIQRAYSPENPNKEIQMIVVGLPRRYRDMILERIVMKTDWNTMQEMYYYSERQMRNILNEALEEFRRRLMSVEKST